MLFLSDTRKVQHGAIFDVILVCCISAFEPVTLLGGKRWTYSLFIAFIVLQAVFARTGSACSCKSICPGAALRSYLATIWYWSREHVFLQDVDLVSLHGSFSGALSRSKGSDDAL